MKKKTKTLAIAALLVALIGGSAILYNVLRKEIAPPSPLQTAPVRPLQPSSADLKEQDNRVKAPDFTVQDAQGNDIKLSDMLGKPVVLNFWASWCPPCKEEMPEFNKVFEELGDEVHFMMVDAVDGSRETKEKGAEYIAQQGFTFPVYYDIKQNAIMEYGIRAFPTSVFIDSEGYLVTGVEGMINEETLRRGIAMITAEAGAQD